MISQELATTLQGAQTREQFTLTAMANGLKVRESLKEPVLFAYVEGAYKDRISSCKYCTRCGTRDDLQDNSNTDGTVIYCGECTQIRSGKPSASYHGYNPNTDRWFNANHIPDHVTASEMFADKLAMYRNEY